MINNKDLDLDLKKYKKLTLQSVKIDGENSSIKFEDISNTMSNNQSIGINICVGDLDDNEVGYVVDIENPNAQTPDKHTSKEEDVDSSNDL